MPTITFVIKKSINMKKTIVFFALTLLFTVPVAAQKLLNIQAPEQPIDTAIDALGFAQSSNCYRFSMPLTMPEAEGRIQFETGGNGYAYIYSHGQVVVQFSVTSCSKEEGYYILNLNTRGQQGNIDKVNRIILVPNGNYACGYSPIIFDFGNDAYEQLYCTF